MKKIYILIAALTSFFVLTGCGDNDLPTYSGPEYVLFSQPSGKFSVKEQGSKEYEITVGTTLPASADLTLSIDVDTDKSTAVEGRDFRLLTPVVTIPAGEMTATVKVEGIYQNLSPEGVKLILNIEGAEGLINPNFGNSYTLTMSQLYEVTMEKLVGSYRQKGYDPDGKVYESDITIRKTSDTEIELVNFDGFNVKLKATVDFDNATISILPNQVLLPDYVGEDGVQHGDVTICKVALNGWNLVGVYDKDPIVGECIYTGNIILESWAMLSWKSSTFFNAYEKTELIKK